MKRPPASAPKHELILKILKSASAPMTAYALLDAARKHGVSAPQTVYRALNRLIDEGAVHRLETINAYVVCADHHHHHSTAIFAICRDCGQVEELSEAGALRRLKTTADQRGFKVDEAVIELKGHCGACSSAHA